MTRIEISRFLDGSYVSAGFLSLNSGNTSIDIIPNSDEDSLLLLNLLRHPLQLRGERITATSHPLRFLQNLWRMHASYVRASKPVSEE